MLDILKIVYSMTKENFKRWYWVAFKWPKFFQEGDLILVKYNNTIRTAVKVKYFSGIKEWKIYYKKGPLYLDYFCVNDFYGNNPAYKKITTKSIENKNDWSDLLV